MTDQNHQVNCEKMKLIADQKVREYFDHYLQNVLPNQLEQAIKVHDGDRQAHGGVERKFMRLMWVSIGVALASGSGVGYGVALILNAGV